jgi:predicted nucleotidyltransferase
MVAETLTLEERIRRELPSLDNEQALELADIVERLITAFSPECVYVFGSRARNDARPDSDVDLMLVIASSDEPGYRRSQAALGVIGPHHVPLGILVWTDEEFNERLDAPSSLPATILREGKILYAA